MPYSLLSASSIPPRTPAFNAATLPPLTQLDTYFRTFLNLPPSDCATVRRLSPSLKQTISPSHSQPRARNLTKPTRTCSTKSTILGVG